MVTRDSRGQVLPHLTDEAKAGHPLWDGAHAQGLVVNGLEFFKMRYPLEHLVASNLYTGHRPSCCERSFLWFPALAGRDGLSKYSGDEVSC
jgi:hypothetical protein